MLPAQAPLPSARVFTGAGILSAASAEKSVRVAAGDDYTGMRSRASAVCDRDRGEAGGGRQDVAVRGASETQDVGVARPHRAQDDGLRRMQRQPDPRRIRVCWGSISKRSAASAAPERGFFKGKAPPQGAAGRMSAATWLSRRRSRRPWVALPGRPGRARRAAGP